MTSGSARTSDQTGSPGAYPGAERMLGVYPQKQQGLFLQRIRILGGRISWRQWRTVIELARRCSQRSTLHITTRQDIELHDIAGPQVQVLQHELAPVGLATHGAGGDGVRNITVCSGCTCAPGAEAAFSVARLVSSHLSDGAGDLPRKFKIGFSGCARACAKPWVSDLGFVAQPNGRFAALGAGSLGPRPGAGILLYEDLAPQDILPLCLAALEFFRDCGARENRSQARWRHLREKVGDEPFQAQLDARFTRLRGSGDWPEVPQSSHQCDLTILWRLQLPNGNISLDDAATLGETAEAQGAQLRINLEHGLELFGTHPCALPDQLAALADLPILIACPGSSSCSQALVDTWAVADAIRQSLAGIPRPNLRICLSGCPNGCAHSAVADMGLIGMRRRHGGSSAECFRLLTGGHNATDDHQATGGEVLFAAEVPAAVERLLSSARLQPPDD